jgi:ABC-type nitrate/sulfonate/bicarbonate transport system permease component
MTGMNASTIRRSRRAPTMGQRPRRGPLSRTPVVWAIRLATFVALIVLWQVWADPISRALFAPPSEVAASLVRQLTEGTAFWGALFASIVAMVSGMSLGVLVGIPLGLIVGRYRPVEFVADPYITFLYVIPSIAFVPLFVMWFGFTFEFQVAMVFESTLFPIMINSAVGAKNVEEDFIEGGRSFQASEWQIMRTIIIPASLPFVFAGLRIAFSSAWVGVVIAQMTGALTGLGGMIQSDAANYETADMFVPILAIMFVGVIIHWLNGAVLMKMTPWHQEQQDTGA